MTSDYDALLATIIDDPDDDLPRLVMADWLEERGGVGNAERAELIRLQVKIAETKRRHIHECTGTVAREIELAPFRHRENELLNTYEMVWFPDYKIRRVFFHQYGTSTGLPIVSLGRGFPEQIRCNWNTWLSKHSTAPWREVVLSDRPAGQWDARMDSFGLGSRTMRLRIPELFDYVAEKYYDHSFSRDMTAHISEEMIHNMLNYFWPKIQFTMPPPKRLITATWNNSSASIADDVRLASSRIIDMGVQLPQFEMGPPLSLDDRYRMALLF